MPLGGPLAISARAYTGFLVLIRRIVLLWLVSDLRTFVDLWILDFERFRRFMTLNKPPRIVEGHSDSVEVATTKLDQIIDKLEKRLAKPAVGGSAPKAGSSRDTTELTDGEIYILTAVREAGGPLTARDIVGKAGMALDTIKHYLRSENRLRKMKLVLHGPRGYYAPPELK
jgi:hypothetical protein